MLHAQSKTGSNSRKTGIRFSREKRPVVFVTSSTLTILSVKRRLVGLLSRKLDTNQIVQNVWVVMTDGGVIEMNEEQELKALVKSFFEDYLNVQEESDSGRVFNPIHISCCRAMKMKPLSDLLNRMRELSGASEK